MEEKTIVRGSGKAIHVGRPLQKGDIGHLIPKADNINDNMDCCAGGKLDYLAYHLMNGFRYGRDLIG